MLNRFAQFSYIISDIYRQMIKIEHDEMVKLGYKGAYTQYLIALSQYPEGLSSTQLCEICDKNKAAISRNLTEMEGHHLITREKNYGALITLTEQGKELAEYVCKKAEQAVIEVALSNEQIEDMYEILNHISKRLHFISNQGLSSNRKGE